MKTISLDKLRDLEKQEYAALKSLNEMKLGCARLGESNEDLDNLIRYQRGKWAMVGTLIDMLEEEDD